MKQSQDMLKEACAQLAMDEAEQTIRNLDEATMKQAEQLFKRHRKAVFAMLSKGAKKKSLFPWLRAAACLILLAGGVWLALTQQAPDPVPLAPVYTASVAPYYSPIPTFSPIPTQTATPIPTHSPIPTSTTTISPTFSPIPTKTPTASPTFSPVPTPSPSPAPTFAPPPAQTPDISAVPEGWSGQYFPQVPSRYHLRTLEQEGQALVAAYEAPDGSAFRFEEYPPQTTLSIPESAKVSYVQVNGSVALQMILEDTVTLCWEAEGSTLALTAPAGEALQLAQSVKNILAP